MTQDDAPTCSSNGVVILKGNDNAFHYGVNHMSAMTWFDSRSARVYTTNAATDHGDRS